MNDTRLAALVESTYSRADFSYRVGVLKEFLSFLFFTAGHDQVSKDSIDLFDKEDHPAGDIIFLRSLPSQFFDGLTKDSFNEELDRLANAADKLPTLSLTIPFMLGDDDRNVVGAWVRRELGRDIVLDMTSDPEIGVGCQIIWNSRLHDFSFDYYLETNRQKIEESVNRVVPRAPLSE